MGSSVCRQKDLALHGYLSNPLLPPFFPNTPKDRYLKVFGVINHEFSLIFKNPIWRIEYSWHNISTFFDSACKIFKIVDDEFSIIEYDGLNISTFSNYIQNQHLRIFDVNTIISRDPLFGQKYSKMKLKFCRLSLKGST